MIRNINKSFVRIELTFCLLVVHIHSYELVL
uniref:Uncharacterized protein n=1 Tax=Siphoviridae sp. ctHip2 TaxID=2827830 RepID=A0A8S5RX16_9CAUD|nr:MAG TPA: hypothetical protein [Siphoviridae sp. ctHip2]